MSTLEWVFVVSSLLLVTAELWLGLIVTVLLWLRERRERRQRREFARWCARFGIRPPD